MPNNVVKSFAKKSGKPAKEVEKIWDEVSEYAKGRKDLDEPYAYITGTVKKRLGLSEGLQRYERLYESDYRGHHTAPIATQGASLDNLTPLIYPEDIYSHNGARYYGDGSPYDNQAISVIQSARGKSNLPIKIYRTVPAVVTNQEKLKKYLDEKKYILRTGKIPSRADHPHMERSEYFDWISGEIERLQNEPPQEEQKITINPGDWVSITKQYALDHGDAHVGHSRLLTKTVPAKTLYTDGNSIHEWGYNP